MDTFSGFNAPVSYLLELRPVKTPIRMRIPKQREDGDFPNVIQLVAQFTELRLLTFSSGLASNMPHFADCPVSENHRRFPALSLQRRRGKPQPLQPIIPPLAPQLDATSEPSATLVFLYVTWRHAVGTFLLFVSESHASTSSLVPI